LNECRIIAFDNERISVLEKRQAHLMDENQETKNAIHETLRQNEHMANAMDSLLSHAMTRAECFDEDQLSAGSPEEMDELCAVMKAKCKIRLKMSGISVSYEIDSELCTYYINQ
jgi:hypothetical protein